ncbi:MAG: PLP-dependent aminotransferase family protein [Halopseudomonas sp.]
MSLEDDLATLSVTIDPSERSPLYQQLAEQIRQRVLSGHLSPGEQLPSSRKLAQLLGISRTSTLNAYDQLVAEGLLITRPASGIFVSALGSAVTPVDGELNRSPAPPPRKAHGVLLGGFDSGPDVELFPFAEWSRSLSRVWRRPDPMLLRDANLGGYFPLRQAVARYVNAVRGVECLPEQVIITAGSRDALALIAKALLEEGDRVALENPCYPPLRHGLKTQGVRRVDCSVDAEGMTLPAIDVSMAWSTPARQYPLGVTMSTERRLQWLELARRTGCWLVEDDFDSEFQYRKVPPAPLYSLAAKIFSRDQQPVILAGSFSKLMFKTLRIGYLIVPESQVDGFLHAQASLGNMASVPTQPALADFLGHRRFASHLRRMRRCYQERRDYLCRLVQQELADKISVDLPDCGMHLLMRINPRASAQEDWQLEQRLKSQGVYTPALSTHYAGEGVQGLLLGFSGLPESSLQQGVQRIKEVWS